MGSLAGIAQASIGASAGMNSAQEAMISQAPAEMQPYLQQQMKMQKEQELLQLITQMMKQMHEMAMSVIKNIGG